MAHTTMTHRGVEYEVSGGWDGESGSYAGPTAVSVIVERADGQPIPGTEIRPGMVQIGLPTDLEAAAERAILEVLESERGAS